MELLADRDPEEARKLLDPGARADDGGRPPLRGHGQPGDGRRHHGALRRAARPRGPRRARLLRGAADAGGGAAVRRGGAPRARASTSRSASGSTPARWSCARSAATCTWTTPRSARRRTWPRAWSSSPRPGTILLTADTLRARRGLRRRSSRSGPVPVKGLARAGRGLRADRGGHGAARASRPRPRAGSPASSGATPSWSSSARRSSRRGAGHGQVVALVGEPGVGKSRLVWEFTHSHRAAGLARAGERLGLLRQGDRATCR